MTVLDGNAIGGVLLETFGADLTAALGTCGACGETRPLAESVTYVRTPGIVVRCRTCSNVLIVLVTRRRVTCADLMGLAALS